MFHILQCLRRGRERWASSFVKTTHAYSWSLQVEGQNKVPDDDNHVTLYEYEIKIDAAEHKRMNIVIVETKIYINVEI